MRLIYYIFRYSSHHLTWHCSGISEDLHIFARNLQHLLAKLFLLLFLNDNRNNNKNNFLQIYVNLQKYWNKVMSNDGLIIEYMDLCHIHLALFQLHKKCFTSKWVTGHKKSSSGSHSS